MENPSIWEEWQKLRKKHHKLFVKMQEDFENILIKERSRNFSMIKAIRDSPNIMLTNEKEVQNGHRKIHKATRNFPKS